MAGKLPETHRALVFHSTTEKPTVETVPFPQVATGACVVKVLTAPILPYSNDVYEGRRQYPLPTPLVGGMYCVGRVVSTGPDATKVKPGQLVHVECMIHGRDNSDELFILGWHGGLSDASQRLMADVWRDGTYAEFVRVPLENVYALDELRLLGSSNGCLGYSIADLAYLSVPLVAFGGLDDIGLKVGERILITPATGWYGGAAVMCALAMGARVIAAGRNAAALNDTAARMERAYGPGRLETVQLSGDEAKDVEAIRKYGPVDAFLEISPPAAANSNILSTAIKTLKRGGRGSIMGGANVGEHLDSIMPFSIKLFGKLMYEPDAVPRFLRLIESGALKLGEAGGIQILGQWQLEDWETAFDTAAQNSRIGRIALFQVAEV